MIDSNSAKGYFVHLVKCALKGEKPNEIPNGVTFEEIYSIANNQKVSNMLWECVSSLDTKPTGQLSVKWQTDYGVLLNQAVYQEMELESLIELFTGLGYEVLALKGSQIRNLYPQPDMRTMGDIDLMLRTDKSKEARQKVRDIMHENGFSDDVMDDGQVDAFRKDNNVYVEIHYEFMHKTHSHYEDFIIDWDKMPRCESNNLLHTMTVEDLYYYNFGHFTKNIYNRGIGFRSVMDSYVIWNKLTAEQKESVKNRIEKIGLSKFNDSILKVGRIWFDGEYDDGKLDYFQDYLLSTYVHGIEKNAITLNLIKTNKEEQSSSKMSFYLRRIFPDADTLYGRFDLKRRIWILLPFLWALRLILLPFSSKKKFENIKREVNTVDSVSREYIDTTKKIFDEVGLEL